MKKILLFLNSDPSTGGNFQYDQSILDAVSLLPSDRYDVLVLYTTKVWERYLNGNIKKIEVSLSHLSKRFLQFLIFISFPLPWLQKVFRRFHPLAKTLIAQKADLYIFPSQETSWSYLVDFPSLAVIHDLMHRYERQFPEVSGHGRFRHREKHFSAICRFSKGILVDSEYGKAQVQESYSVPPEKIFSLPYIPPKYIYNPQISSNFESKYSLPPKFIFYPAQFWQHKNHNRLIMAIHALRAEIEDIQLIFVGSKKNGYHHIVKLVKELDIEDAVHFMGYVPNDDLPEFYKRARAMIMPTFFGPTNIPPLEAFVLGCPVAVSNIYGIPEQVGDAALLFDPKSVEEIADAIKKLWIDDRLCEELIQRGEIRNQKWGQSEFNNRFLEIIEKLTAPESQR